jgi:hypothetical protein
MWNLIIKFMICIYMSESFQMIKMSLNGFIFLVGFKKDHISINNKFLVCLILKTIPLGGILVPPEDTLLIPCINIDSFLLRYQGIVGGTKDPDIPHRRNVAIPHFIRSIIFKSMRWTLVFDINCT